MPSGGEERAANEEHLLLEQELLRAVYRRVCAGGEALTGAESRQLANYRFRDPILRVILDALCEIRAAARPADSSAAPNTIRERLLQRVTLRGFPDVDLEPIMQRGLQPRGQDEETIQNTIARLTGSV